MTARRKKPLVAPTASRPQREHYATTHETRQEVEALRALVVRVLVMVEQVNATLRGCIEAASADIAGHARTRGAPAGVAPFIVAIGDDGVRVFVTDARLEVMLAASAASELARQLQLAADVVASQPRKGGV